MNEASKGPRLPLHGKKVFILEDETYIAMLIQDVVMQAGVNEKDIIIEARPTQMRIRACVCPLDNKTIALLDFKLGENSTSETVADRLAGRGIPFVFVTGNGRAVPERFANVPIVEKPFDEKSLVRAIIKAFDARLKYAE